MMTHTDATELLKRLIAIPSVSRDEKAVADFLEEQLKQQGLAPMRHHNNLWCVGRAQLSNRPTLLLNAHIDTVKPAAGWLSDPFTPQVEGERLYGLGSTDCGGGLVSLLAVFTRLETR
uniref:M20/M25/M40 family metallo-hydrolase n=1 Tax=Alloprevotella sp. TaxID=1872471 RepID=UPI00402788D4